MKLWPVTNPDKRNTESLEKLEDDVVSKNYGIIIKFPVYGQLGAISKLGFGCMVCNF